MQLFDRTKVDLGKIVLEGKLAIDGSYDLIIKPDSGATKYFKYVLLLCVEGDARYEVAAQERVVILALK